MPIRMLRFCPQCLATQQAFSRDQCGTCGSALLPLLDSDGALSRTFLASRGTCCDTGCRNCPYNKTPAAPPSKTKTCERCSASFQCGSTACWCNAVTMRPVTLKWLERTYTDCLCPTCLAEFATPMK